MLLFMSFLSPSWGDISFWSYLPIRYKSLYVQLLLHSQKEFLKSLHACILPYGETDIITAFWYDHVWRSYCPFWLNRLFYQVCMHNSSHILNGNSWKLWLAYYHVEIFIFFWWFNWTVSERVIAPFWLEYYIQMIAIAIPYTV